MPQLFYHLGKYPTTHLTEAWVDPGVTLDIKSLASARNCIPNHPACSLVHIITMLSQLAEITRKRGNKRKREKTEIKKQVGDNKEK